MHSCYLTVSAVLMLAMASTTAGQPRCNPQEIAKLIASDAAPNDYFGYSVSVSGDTAIIGAFSDDHHGKLSGSAYVFREIGGDWQEIVKLTPADSEAGDNFGGSVSISGDTALIAAPSDDDLGMESGSVYVFREVSGTWQQTAKLTASDSDYYFGFSVSVDGDTALIGAANDDGSGSAYVFREIGGQWEQIAKLTAGDAAPGNFFGSRLSLSGDTALIGAWNDGGSGDPKLPPDGSGSAYVFREIGGEWQQIAKLTASDAAAGDLFGYSVALNDDTAMIGALYDYHDDTTFGSSYVFREVAGVWTEIAKLTSTDALGFGSSVSLIGDTAVIGNLDDDAGAFSGSAYVFREISGQWEQIDKLTAFDASAEDLFGWSVAVSDDTAFIGAPASDADGSDTGSAYVFDLNCDDGNPTGDLDGDGDGDLTDFGIFNACLGGPGNPPSRDCPDGVNADLDGDGDVDMQDFAIFQQNFTGP